MLNTKPIKKLSLSDIHFGKKTKSLTPEIRDMFSRNAKEFSELDYIIIPGDVFDKQLYGDSRGLLDAVDFMIFVSNFCIRHDIKIRWLKGTPSHDRKQQELLKVISDGAFTELDYLFIDILCIVEESDHTCLYIPDEIRLTTHDTYLDCIQLLHEFDIYQVDSIVMHGAFPHSLGFGEVGVDLHDEEHMLNICRGYIISGHIHTHQVFKRIITPGPVSRLSFGEEEAKGGVITYEFPDEKLNTFKFVENTKAPLYDSIFCEATTYSDLIEELLPRLKVTPKGSFIRLQFDSGNPLGIRNNFADISELFTFTHMIVELKEEVVTHIPSDFNVNKRWDRIGINEITTYLRDRLETKGMEPSQIDIVMNTLEETS